MVGPFLFGVYPIAQELHWCENMKMRTSTTIVPTELSVLDGHSIHFWCPNMHVQSILVSDLLALPSPPQTTADALDRARCKTCGQMASEIRISFQGGAYTG